LEDDKPCQESEDFDKRKVDGTLLVRYSSTDDMTTGDEKQDKETITGRVNSTKYMTTSDETECEEETTTNDASAI
jgi:hypothetical protein